MRNKCTLLPWLGPGCSAGTAKQPAMRSLWLFNFLKTPVFAKFEKRQRTGRKCYSTGFARASRLYFQRHRLLSTSIGVSASFIK
jgi:hypothetical protein